MLHVCCLEVYICECINIQIFENSGPVQWPYCEWICDSKSYPFFCVHNYVYRIWCCSYVLLPTSCFLTSVSDMRFLLVHDVSRSHEQLKSFFSEMNEILVKVLSYYIKQSSLDHNDRLSKMIHYVKWLQAILNPFYTPNTPITSSNFKRKASLIARKYLS